MTKYLKVLCTREQITMLVFLLFGSLATVIFEFISIGSIPIFTTIIINQQSESQLFKIIDFNFLKNFSQEEIIIYGSLCLGLIFLLKNILLSGLIYFEGKLVRSIRIYLGEKLFKKYLFKNYKFHLKTNPSILLRNVSAEVSQTSSVILSCLKLVRELLVLIAIFSLLLMSSFLITISIFFFLTFIVTIFFVFTKRILEKNSRLIQSINASQIQHITQSFNAIKEIKILNKENFVNTIAVKNMVKFENPFLINFFLTSLPRPFLEVLVILSLILISILITGSNQSIISLIPILSLFTVSAVRLIPSFNSISTALANIKSLRPSYKLVYSNLVDDKDTDKISDINFNNTNLSFQNKIVFKDVSFTYENKNSSVLKNVNLEIIKGSNLGISGKSGSGKSTLINLLIGLLQPDKGFVCFDDKDIKDNVRKLQSLISYVPQDIYLLDDTIKKNIAIGEDEDQIDYHRLDIAINSAELKDYIDKLPEKLETFVGNRGVRISGGQKQRIGIARALYLERDILILDEATNSLDIENEEKIMDNIINQYQSKTIICIAHSNKVLEKFDNILSLNNGRTYLVKN
tara:strand:- start:27985 stop:29709 length:1725 start_codon:yes stop_codon:yes gene_type:complete